MAFVDKVKKNGVEYEIHDTEGRVKIEGNSLVIPEQSGEGPEPIITIDGVGYFHKCEFDLTEFTQENLNDFYDILTGEVSYGSIEHAYIQISSYGPNYPIGSTVAKLYAGSDSPVIYVIAQGTSVPASVNYTSRAFICVDTWQEATGEDKICLPTCSAYYGFLSEDGNTFISYFNLKGEGAPGFVDSVKQGETTISLHGKDERLPSAKQSDAGKVLKVTNAGEYGLEEIHSGAMYLHHIVMNHDIGSNEFKVVTDSEDEFIQTEQYGMPVLRSTGTSVIMPAYSYLPIQGPTGNTMERIYKFDINTGNYEIIVNMSSLPSGATFTDTVTAL